MRGLFITGTDTEIGKTVITGLLTFGLQQQGLDCLPVKPVATGCQDIDGRLISEDVLAYARIADISEPLHDLSPCCLKRPASPHFAAACEDATIDPQSVVQEVQALYQRTTHLLVEGIGGWLVPITDNYLVADLAGDLDLPIIVVAANRLGMINHTLLTLEAIRMYDEELLGVIVTHPTQDDDEDLLQNNIDTIRTIGNTEILGVIPHLDESTLYEGQQEKRWQHIQGYIQWNQILDRLRAM